jgi:hypothetical protein
MTQEREKKEQGKGNKDVNNGKFIEKQERVKPWPKPDPKPPKDKKD